MQINKVPSLERAKGYGLVQAAWIGWWPSRAGEDDASLLMPRGGLTGSLFPPKGCALKTKSPPRHPPGRGTAVQRHQGRPEKAWPCRWPGRDGGKGASQYGTPGIRPGTFCPPTFLSSGRQQRQLGSQGRGRKPRLGGQPRRADLGAPCALTPPLPRPLKRPPNCLLWIRAPALPQPCRPQRALPRDTGELG